MEDVLIGIDVGSTNTKVDIYDMYGKARASRSFPSPLSHPHPGHPSWTCYDVEAFWGGLCQALNSLMSDRGRWHVIAIGFAGMAETGLLVGPNGEVLSETMAWFDERGEAFVPWWKEKVGIERIFNISGQHLNGILGINKLLWSKQADPASFRAARWWFNLQDFFVYRMTGEVGTDYTLASRTMVFDVGRLVWSEELLAQAEIPVTMLPPAFQSGSCIGTVNKKAAEATGLPYGTPVAVGAHDHACAAFSHGVVRPGLILASTGTSESIVAVTNVFQPTPGLATGPFSIYPHVVKGRYLILSGLPSCGSAMEWFVRCFHDGAASKEISAIFDCARDSPPGANGVRFKPYLAGNVRVPGARAAFTGIGLHNSRADFARAVLEGLAFEVKRLLEDGRRLMNFSVDKLICCGKPSQLDIWLELKANIIGRQIMRYDLLNPVSLGAALLAGIGCGIYTEEEAIDLIRPKVRSFIPDATLTAIYEDIGTKWLYEES